MSPFVALVALVIIPLIGLAVFASRRQSAADQRFEDALRRLEGK